MPLLKKILKMKKPKILNKSHFMLNKKIYN